MIQTLLAKKWASSVFHKEVLLQDLWSNSVRDSRFTLSSLLDHHIWELLYTKNAGLGGVHLQTIFLDIWLSGLSSRISVPLLTTIELGGILPGSMTRTFSCRTSTMRTTPRTPTTRDASPISRTSVSGCGWKITLSHQKSQNGSVSGTTRETWSLWSISRITSTTLLDSRLYMRQARCTSILALATTCT